MNTVAALYIDPKRGPYPSLPGVQCWGLPERDATLYAGPHPVVAHPPCASWGSLRHLALRDDRRAECGPRAIDQVRAFGGLLEHPAHSLLWSRHKLPRPGERPDAWGGWTVEVEQVAWGHPARKRTWLYLVGIDRAVVDAGIRRGGTITHWTSGTYTPGRRGTVPAGVGVVPPRLRHLTPPAFAAWLVDLARGAQK